MSFVLYIFFFLSIFPPFHQTIYCVFANSLTHYHIFCNIYVWCDIAFGSQPCLPKQKGDWVTEACSWAHISSLYWYTLWCHWSLLAITPLPTGILPYHVTGGKHSGWERFSAPILLANVACHCTIVITPLVQYNILHLICTQDLLLRFFVSVLSAPSSPHDLTSNL